MYFELYMFFKKKNEFFDDQLDIKLYTASYPLLKSFGFNVTDINNEFNFRFGEPKMGKISFDRFAKYYIN